MCEVRGILNICIFDREGRLLASEGADRTMSGLAKADMPETSEVDVVRKGAWAASINHGLLSIAIEVVGEWASATSAFHHSMADIERQQMMSYLFVSEACWEWFSIIMTVLLNLSHFQGGNQAHNTPEERNAEYQHRRPGKPGGCGQPGRDRGLDQVPITRCPGPCPLLPPDRGTDSILKENEKRLLTSVSGSM
jgi:hypothetical protein